MPEVTTLQAAAMCGVHPATVRQWYSMGLIRCVGKQTNPYGAARNLYDEADVLRMVGKPATGRPRTAALVRDEPPTLIATQEPLPMGLLVLEQAGRFRPEAHPPLGGGVCLGRVRFGADWLRVYRADNGVVYHEQATWMDDDPDWMDNPEHAETLVLLEAA